MTLKDIKQESDKESPQKIPKGLRYAIKRVGDMDIT